MKNQESLNNYHHSMECNFIVKTIFNDKTSKSAEKIKNFRKNQRYSNLEQN